MCHHIFGFLDGLAVEMSLQEIVQEEGRALHEMHPEWKLQMNHGLHVQLQAVETKGSKSTITSLTLIGPSQTRKVMWKSLEEIHGLSSAHADITPAGRSREKHHARLSALRRREC